MDIPTLAASLPSGSAPPLANTEMGLRVNCQAIPGFVAPELSTISDPSDARATLISAPAAAGKSTSALAIASDCNAAFLDLAGRLVGDGSFTGLLDQGFGEEASFHFRQALKSGQATLVIDSLDETLVRSRETAFVQFLKGLCWFLRTSSGKANVLMLARQDTAQYIRLTFQDELVSLREFELEYFDMPTSYAFIESKLDLLYDKKGMPHSHKIHTKNYVAARNDLIDTISKAIGGGSLDDPWSHPETRRLLGYSPVLEGLAGYLCVSDFRALGSRVAPGDDSLMGGWNVLSKLLIELLEREQQKFLAAWPDDLQKSIFPTNESIGKIYSPREQCRHLLKEVLHIPFDVSLHNVPTSLHVSYRDALMSQLNDHPLRGEGSFVNALFKDFAIAMVLTSADDDPKARAAALSYLRSAATLATPATGWFILAQTQGSAVDGDIVDVLINSLASREDQREQYDFYIEAGGTFPHLVVSLLSRNSSDPDSESVSRNIRPSQVICMPPRCRSLALIGAEEVLFPGSCVRIGPNVEIVAELITFDGSQDLHIISNGVWLQSDGIVSDWAQRVIPDRDDFVLVANEAVGWASRYARPNTDADDDGQDQAGPVAFRKLLRRFRNTQHNSPGDVQADRSELDNFVLKNDSTCAAIFDALKAAGWIKTLSRAYLLSGAFFNSMQTSYAAVRRGELSEPIVNFLKGFE